MILKFAVFISICITCIQAGANRMICENPQMAHYTHLCTLKTVKRTNFNSGFPSSCKRRNFFINDDDIRYAKRIYCAAIGLKNVIGL